MSVKKQKKSSHIFSWLMAMILIGGLITFSNCGRELTATSGKSFIPVEGNDGTDKPTDPFISVWKTTQSNESIMLPLRENYLYDFVVDWGDETEPQTIVSWDDTNKIHTYENPGTYTVTIDGLVQAWYFNFGNGQSVPNNKDKIIEVLNLGDVGWTDLSYAFASCVSLTFFHGGVIDDVTSLEGMFFGASSLGTIDLNDWDTSKVTKMRDLFNEAYNAKPLIANWNTSKVTDMSGMFSETNYANPDLSNWDTSKVTNMSTMFSYAAQANPDTTNWIVNQVTNMDNMFRHALQANPNVSNWQVSNLIEAQYMFKDAASANPDFSNWDFGLVEDMEQMMTGAINFEANNYSQMLLQIADTFNYGNVQLGAHQTEYALYAQAAKTILEDEGWIISDAGML